MTKIMQQGKNIFYQCEECGLRYKEQKHAVACEAWCKEHKSCNLDIIKYAEKEIIKTGKLKEIFNIAGIPVLVASLCCVAPIILVVFGLGTVTFASSLADTLYGGYKWVFRLAGLILLGISVVLYLRRAKGICTIDEAKKRRNEIMNIVMLALIAGIVGYIVWLYVVVEYLGKWLAIWN